MPKTLLLSWLVSLLALFNPMMCEFKELLYELEELVALRRTSVLAQVQ